MSFRDLRRQSAEIDEQPRGPVDAIDVDHADPPAGTDPAVAASRRSFLRRAATGGAIAFGATAVPVGAMIPSALAQSTTTTTGGAAPKAGAAPTAGAVPTAGAAPTAGAVPTAGAATTSGSTPGTVPGTSVPAAGKTKDPPKVKGDDLTLVVYLQTIELAAVAAYTAIVATGKLTSPVAETARVFGMHHQDQADALAAFAGSEALNRPNATLVRQLLPPIAAATTANEIVRIAYDLEESITATFAAAMGELEEWEIAELVATMMPVTSQQALAWSLDLETDIDIWAKDIKTWIPNFQNDSRRYDPAKYPAG